MSTTAPVTESRSVQSTQRPVQRRGFWPNFVRKPAAMVSLIYIALIVLASLFATWIAPYGPNQQDLGASLEGPTARHWLGTGELGKDELSRILYGGRVTLLGVLIALVVIAAIGIPLGIIAGYRGGWFDWLVLKGSELVFAIPSLILLLVVLAVFPGNESAAMVVVGLLWAPQVARVIRARTLGVRQELFVRAAVANGISDRVILSRHIFPMVTGVIAVQLSIYGGAAVLTETGLGFLGVGTTKTSWGNLIAEASNNIGTNPWLLIPSGVIVITFVVALGLLGDGIRDALEERRQPPALRRQAQQTPSQRPATPAAEAAALGPVRPDALLTVRGLTVTLPVNGHPTEVIRDVGFDLQPGEALGIVGESGCGKSITAASLLGLLPYGGRISSGSVMFDGEELANASAAALHRIRGKRIGWISQDPVASLDPSFTVGSQVAECVRLYTGCTKRKARARALELLALVRLPDPKRVAKSYPHQLSGGMAQRVGIAAAIAGNPALIIADEPTTALDVTVQAEILDLLRDLQSNGTAVILITHDWGVLCDFSQRAVVMYAGEVVEQADINQIVTSPRHPYTAALLESDPHDAVRGKPLVALEGVVPEPVSWPVGCHFQNRCPLVTEACRAAPIPLISVDAGPRTSRCIRTGELAAAVRVGSDGPAASKASDPGNGGRPASGLSVSNRLEEGRL